MRPEKEVKDGFGDEKWTHHAELDTRLAVSTVPPRTTSFMPSTTDEAPAPATRGWMRDLKASMGAVVLGEGGGSQCGEWGGDGAGQGGRRETRCNKIFIYFIS